jgi:ATP-dependent Clp protease ATP-binding subunit ClpA
MYASTIPTHLTSNSGVANNWLAQSCVAAYFGELPLDAAMQARLLRAHALARLTGSVSVSEAHLVLAVIETDEASHMLEGYSVDRGALRARLLAAIAQPEPDRVAASGAELKLSCSVKAWIYGAASLSFAEAAHSVGVAHLFADDVLPTQVRALMGIGGTNVDDDQVATQLAAMNSVLAANAARSADMDAKIDRLMKQHSDTITLHQSTNVSRAKRSFRVLIGFGGLMVVTGGAVALWTALA